MNAPTIEELVKWIEGTAGPGDSPEKIMARFRTAFALGTPRSVFADTERNFTSAMIAYGIKHGKTGS